MRQATQTLRVETGGRGFYDITPGVLEFLHSAKINIGLVTAFCRHTSASLSITENADPNVLRDLDAFLARIAPEGAHYRHDDEGPDDMPAHIRAALTQTQLSIPVLGGAPALGTWQGVFLIEHRRRPHRREVVVHMIGE